MLAVGVEHVDRALQITKCDEVDAEVVEWHDAALGEIGTPGNLKPSRRLHAWQALHVTPRDRAP
jgi:hypothetical protein